MTFEVLLILSATTAAGVAVLSSWRAIQRNHLSSGPVAHAQNTSNRQNLKAGVDAIYEQVQTDLEKVAAEVAHVHGASASPVITTFPISGLKFVRTGPEFDVALAISFLRDHLDSADEDEVQRMMPMLQYLEQKALERVAQLHPPVTHVRE